MDCCANIKMKRSKTFLSRVISTLCENTRKSGDPLGFRSKYWYHWANDNSIRKNNDCVLITGRMYQMLPYLLKIMDLMNSSKGILSMWGGDKLLSVGKSYVGELFVRGAASREKKIRQRVNRILKGVFKALSVAGYEPGYLFGEDPYSGALLSDLGLEKELTEHLEKVAKLLEEKQVKELITVDPHTTFIFREVLPRYVGRPELKVRLYSEILAENHEKIGGVKTGNLPQKVVIHDPCVSARELNVIEPVRTLVQHLGIELLEPENTGRNTGCCGGPVEYAFPELTSEISRLRVKELSCVCNDILVSCPICFANLSKYEAEFGIRVWDTGEILYEYLLGEKNGITT